MASSRNTVRTRFGCQNCRMRHLKCDELRPQCARCQTAGLRCNRDSGIKFRHGLNPRYFIYDVGHEKKLTIVLDRPSVKTTRSGRSELDFGKSQPWMKTAPSLVFLDGIRQEKLPDEHEKRNEELATGSAVVNPTSHPNVDVDIPGQEYYATSHIVTERASSLPAMETDMFGLREDQQRSAVDDYHLTPMLSAASNPADSPIFDGWQHDNDSAATDAYITISPSHIPSAPVMRDSYRGSDRQLDMLQIRNTNDNSGSGNKTSDALPGIYLDSSVWPLSNKEEASLLRYYCERLARNFDLSDPDRHFRNVVPQRAATCPILLNAIYALSARHMSRVGNYDPLVSDRFHQQCLERVIPVLNDSAAVLDENLLASAVILRHLEEFEVPSSGYSPSDRQSHLLGSHALIKAQSHAPMSEGLRQAAFWVGLRQEIYVAFVNQRSIAIALENPTTDDDTEAAADYIWSRRMVTLCARVIRFCFGEGDKLNSAYDSLAESVSDWSERKNSSFTPIFYKEPEGDSIFPEIWFLNDEVIIGWQHYYIAKLLLCAHNPRVPRLGPGTASAFRTMDEEIKDYVRVLCGLAMSNPDTAPNFTYASMAIVAAGDKFTTLHEQEALLNVLNVCDTQYAFPTRHARENLKAAWGWSQEIE